VSVLEADVMTRAGQQVDLVEYGNKDGQLVVYFHGVPGAIEECSIFDGYAKDNNLKIMCFDRFAIDEPCDREDYYRQLANQVKHNADGKPVDIIGFSLGAHVALEVSALLDDQVRHTHLVSAAAPINSGSFINDMAGGLVFTLAMKKPFIFSLLTQFQKLLALLAPRLLVSMLFASSAGKDKALRKQPDFKTTITPILKRCFQNRSNGYMRDIKFYTTWPGELGRFTSGVYLWHGTEDNWTPLSMADYLCTAIPGANRVEAMQGLSHYSCLYEAAPRICAQLGKA
jgi:pimeloyl-ACP methyl ester carboxylesterase